MKCPVSSIYICEAASALEKACGRKPTRIRMSAAMQRELGKEIDPAGLVGFNDKGEPDSFMGLVIEVHGDGDGDGFVLLPE